jgi:hypothetical protein
MAFCYHQLAVDAQACQAIQRRSAHARQATGSRRRRLSRSGVTGIAGLPRGDRGLTLAELSRRTVLYKSTLLRLLASLERQRYVVIGEFS